MLADLFGADGIIVIVCVVVVLLFGGAKLPKLARGLGSASHEFKKGLTEGDPDSATPLPGPSATPSTTPSATPSDVHKDAGTS
jgi:sec-independent protein translocase protein TatA